MFITNYTGIKADRPPLSAGCANIHSAVSCVTALPEHRQVFISRRALSSPFHIIHIYIDIFYLCSKWQFKLAFVQRLSHTKYILLKCSQCRCVILFSGEICGFRVHNGPGGSGSAQFEAVVLDRSTGEGLVRSKEPLDCESQKEHSFTIQAYDCGEGPDGTNSKKSHK